MISKTHKGGRPRYLRSFEREGYNAFNKGIPNHKNPHAREKLFAWSRGWQRAKRATIK